MYSGVWVLHGRVKNKFARVEMNRDSSLKMVC